MSTTNDTKRIASAELQALLDKTDHGPWTIVRGKHEMPHIHSGDGYAIAKTDCSLSRRLWNREKAKPNAELLALSRSLAEEVLELRARLAVFCTELEEYGFIGIEGAAEAHENHYTRSPAYFDARAILSKINPNT